MLEWLTASVDLPNWAWIAWLLIFAWGQGRALSMAMLSGREYELSQLKKGLFK